MRARKKLTAVWVMGVLTLAVLLLVVLTAGTYQSTAAGKEKNENLRSALSYLATRIRALDTADVVELREAGGMLVLQESSGDACFETRIYVYQGNLMEEYVPTGQKKDPTVAQVIAKTDTFAATFAEENLLRLQTDAGEIYMCLHSAEAGHGA